MTASKSAAPAESGPIEASTPGLVMLFDAQCVLCSNTVRFVLAHERAPVILFAGTAGEAGRALAADHGLSEADLDASFVLIEDGRVLTRSDAALRLARELRAP